MLKLFKRKTDPKKELEAVFGRYELPTFPAIIVSTLDKVRDGDSTSAQIAELISADPGISARLLGTANSAAFALRNEVKNVQHAVTLLGRSHLESMLVSIAVHDTLPSDAVPGFDQTRFWSTAAQRAVTAAALAERIEPASRSESFTAALLQDMAVPLLAHNRGEQYGPLLARWHAAQAELVELERQTFDWSHATVGGWIAASWQFPEHLSVAIAEHHDEFTGQESLPAVKLVAALREEKPEAGIERLVETARDQFRIAPDDTLALVDDSAAEAERIATMFC